jgi:DNA-directed RNA polymerase specialized sigma24 family protein
VDPDPPRPPESVGGLTDALFAELGSWLLDRCDKAAASRPGLDAADIYQQSIQRLLTSSITVDPGRAGVRAYLGQCVDWTAADLHRQRIRACGEYRSDEAIVGFSDRAVAEAGVFESELPTDELFASAGLSPPQQAVMRNDLGDNLPLVEFAVMTSRSYSSVRKDRQRAVAKLRSWLGLDGDETRVLLAVRRTGSTAAAAQLLRMPPADVRLLLGSAQLKIDQKFDERSVGRNV